MSEELNNYIGMKVVEWEYNNIEDIARMTVEIDTRKLTMQQAEEIIRNNIAEVYIKKAKHIEELLLRGDEQC